MPPTLTPAQIEIAQSNKRFRVINAGRRFGKTVLAVEEMITCAVEKNEARIAYIAPTYQQARDIAWDMLLKRAKPILEKVNESRLEIQVKNKHGTTSKIVLRGWESVETLRGQSFHLLILDEVAMMRKFTVTWQEVLVPTLTDTRGFVMFISTPKGFNHFYDLYNQTGDSWQSFHYTSYDNPHIPIAELEERKQDLTEDSFAQEYMGDFRKQQGLVFKEFTRDIHLFDGEVENVARTYVGVDFGYRNPCAVMTIKKDNDGTFYVTDEWYRTGKNEQEIVDYALAIQCNAYYPDPENPSAISLFPQTANVQEVVKGKGSVVSGVDIMRNLFKQRRLKIHKRCTNLIQEMETYHYDDDKHERNENEAPVKDSDHAIDAVRYVIMMNEIQGGDVQATPAETPLFDYSYS